MRAAFNQTKQGTKHRVRRDRIALLLGRYKILSSLRSIVVRFFKVVVISSEAELRTVRPADSNYCRQNLPH